MIKLIYPELSYKIVGILMKIHTELWLGYQEQHYTRAVAKELRRTNIKFEQEKELPLKYQGELIGKYKFDFVVENKIILEIKVADSLHSKFIKQLLSYLKSSDFKLGILVNFGKDKLEYKRLVN